MRDSYGSLPQAREAIVKSWYHPDSGKEVVVDAKTAGDMSGDWNSHTNHVYMNPSEYGFRNVKEIFQGAGHSPETASNLESNIKKQHEQDDNYVDWHDPLVHAMHKHGWVRIIKNTDWRTDKPKIYAGSHDMELSERAARDLAKKDKITRKLSVEEYSPKSLDHPDHFTPSKRHTTNEIDLD